jgi:hypothetical protein
MVFDAKTKTIINRNNKLLQISQDWDDDENDLTQRTVVLNWSPHTLSIDHYHIQMNKEEVKQLYCWLKKFLQEVK